MRRKDISFEFTNVNSKLIEEAAEYRSSGKKLIRVLALAACIAVLVMSIPLALILNRENDNVKMPAITETPDNNGDNEIIQDSDPVKVIFCSNSVKDELVKKLAGERVEIRDSSEIESEDGEFEIDVSQVEDIPAKLYVTVNGVKLSCTFDNYVYSSRRFEWDSRPGVNLARYKIDNVEFDSAYLDYSLYDEKVYRLQLSDTKEDYSNIEESIDKETAREMSDKVIGELFGNAVYEQYQFLKCVAQSDMYANPVINKYFLTQYIRYVNGFPTSQLLTVKHGVDGELISVACPAHKVDLLEKIDVDDILTAEKKIMEIVEDAELLDKHLTVQTVENEDKAYWYVAYYGTNQWGIEGACELFYPIG